MVDSDHGNTHSILFPASLNAIWFTLKERIIFHTFLRLAHLLRYKGRYESPAFILGDAQLHKSPIRSTTPKPAYFASPSYDTNFALFCQQAQPGFSDEISALALLLPAIYNPYRQVFKDPIPIQYIALL